MTAPSVTLTSSDWPFTALAFIVLTSAAMIARHDAVGEDGDSFLVLRLKQVQRYPSGVWRRPVGRREDRERPALRVSSKPAALTAATSVLKLPHWRRQPRSSNQSGRPAHRAERPRHLGLGETIRRRGTRVIGNEPPPLLSDEQIERLSLLRDITQAGHSIGHAAKLPTEKLRQLAKESDADDGRRRDGRSPGSPRIPGDCTPP